MTKGWALPSTGTLDHAHGGETKKNYQTFKAQKN